MIHSNSNSHLSTTPFYVSLDKLDAVSSSPITPSNSILISYGVHAEELATFHAQHVHVNLQPLGDANSLECWRVQSPLKHAAWNGINYSHNDELLFANLRIPEADNRRINPSTLQAYRRMEVLRRQLGYPHLLRTWNYFADINAPSNESTRYQEFCQGRHRALQEDAEFIDHLPAATVIGTYTPGYVIYFLAARESGIPIANPRQLNPFEYPRQYGPNSPSFVRALVKHWPRRSDLYVSGTASIVGHESQHTGNRLKQLDETLRNLDTLIAQAARQESLAIRATAELTYLKIYLRDAADFDVVQQRLHERLGTQIPCLFLHGEICRDDLLVEIEGMYLDG